MRFRRSPTTYRNPLFAQTPNQPWLLRHRWILLVFAAGLVAAGAYLVYGLPSWQLHTLKVQGEYTLPLESLRALTRAQMQSRWLLFFKQDSLWAFDTRAFERRLREKWIFSELHVERSLPDTLKLTLVEESPAFSISHPTGLYSVDRTGVVSTVLTGPLPHTPALSLSSIPEKLELGQSILSTSDAAFLWNFLQELRERANPAFEITTITLSLPPDPTVRFHAEGDWDIVADRLGDTTRQVQAFLISYDQKLRGKKFEYVDVSVPARVYIK